MHLNITGMKSISRVGDMAQVSLFGPCRWINLCVGGS